MPVAVGITKQKSDSACQRRLTSFTAGSSRTTGGPAGETAGADFGQENPVLNAPKGGLAEASKWNVGVIATRPTTASAQPQISAGPRCRFSSSRPKATRSPTPSVITEAKRSGRRLWKIGNFLSTYSGR